MEKIRKYIDELTLYVEKKLNFSSNVKVLLRDDMENASTILGKTAYYNPQTKEIVLYVSNRHPKDILRSYAHEIYHCYQDSQGKFDNITTTEEGYAQNNEHLRKMEKEAYMYGNILFRDWTDSKKNELNETIYKNKEKKEMKYNFFK